ncbi:NADH pyrophosphatase-like protein [Emericellopsis cladophorae]|uniref:NAD(+) diphosphatase n=1 Tax=Emericellopsis cladophorae TaxID=2686198 RepID=A0A9P9XVZ1_9HYPO|nr:NADH pyrophosphatase-like protein [Emericellopsis cladophorae]KAI6778841.1 NADH pyrophosphatase-like protein [Emericellopsis cladophorae]
MSNSALPEVSYLTNDDSMLSRRFGKEILNYYAGGTLNRYSFLRPDTAFLSRAATQPNTRFVALNGLNPLVKEQTDLQYLKLDDVKPLIGEQPFVLSEEDEIKNFDSSKKNPLLVFLGLLDDESAEEIATTNHGSVKGQPFFAVDITPREPFTEAATALLKDQEAQGASVQASPMKMVLHPESAAIYAQARSMIDWNTRSPFCAGCGQPSLSVHAGYKRVCPPTDAASSTPRGECLTRQGVSNLCFPRSDPTMIAAVVSADGQRVLLGRQKRFPPHWYSTLAGFLEPGESIEEAVRREVWEEAGVYVGRVVIHSSQPWPYPSSLMIGAIAQARPGKEDIVLNDKELDDAKWFSIDDVRTALNIGTGGLGEGPPEGYKEGDLRLPPAQAIANRLLSAVAEGFLVAVPKI